MEKPSHDKRVFLSTDGANLWTEPNIASLTEASRQNYSTYACIAFTIIPQRINGPFSFAESLHLIFLSCLAGKQIR